MKVIIIASALGLFIASGVAGKALSSNTHAAPAAQKPQAQQIVDSVECLAQARIAGLASAERLDGHAPERVVNDAVNRAVNWEYSSLSFKIARAAVMETDKRASSGQGNEEIMKAIHGQQLKSCMAERK